MPRKQQPIVGPQNLWAEIAAEARAELAAEKKAAQALQRKAAAEELRRLRVSYPKMASKASKKGEFDYKALYKEAKKYVNPSNLPKLKHPEKAGAKSKKQILQAFDEIARRKERGMVFYKIKSKRNRAKFGGLFDSYGESEIFKGGWADAVKVNSGKAKLSFDKQGNVKLKYSDKMAGIYVPIDGEALLDDPEKYCRRILKRFKGTQTFFPVTVKDQICKGYGGSKKSLPPIWDILEKMDEDSGKGRKSLGDFIGALLTYVKA